jgi:hypothetical protein
MEILLYGSIYTAFCVGFALRAQQNGWDFWDTFMIGFLFSPLFTVFKSFRKPA